MENRSYTPKQVEEIKILDELTNVMQDFASGLNEDTSWVATVLNAPKALKEGAFENLGAYALEEAALLHPSDLDANLARAEFVSYLGAIEAFRDDADALRRSLNGDDWRFIDLIARMAECAGLYDHLMANFLDEEGWTGFKSNNTTFTWNMPGKAQVHAVNMTTGEDVQYWNFWVQKEALMYCAFTVGIDGDYDPEGDPDFERMAWRAWHDAGLVLEAMESPAYEAAARVEAENQKYEMVMALTGEGEVE